MSLNQPYTEEKLTRKNVFRRLVIYMKPYWKSLSIAFFVLLLATAADVLGPILIKIFIDDYLTPGIFAREIFLLLGGGYILLLISSVLLNYYQLLSFHRIAQWIIQQLRIDVFSKVQHLGLSYFDRTPGGSLVSRITNDTEAIKDLYVSVLSTFLQNIIFLLGIFITMFILNVQLASFFLIMVPLIFALMYTYRLLSSKVYHLARQKLSQLNAKLSESLQGMNIIQAFSQEKRFRDQFNQVNQEHTLAKMKNMKLDGLLLRSAVDLLYLIALILVLYFFGLKSLQGSLEIGVLYAFILYIDRFFEPVNMMMQQLSRYQQAIVAAERVFGLLDEQNMAPAQKGDQRSKIKEGFIQFKDVSFSYDGKSKVLQHISFTARQGETVALVGHTGSGKSSIINLLLRFYPADQGEILIDGIPLQHYPEEELRSKVGLVLQDPFLFSETVGENIGLHNPAIGEKQIREAAQFVQAAPFIEKLPEQYNQQVGERGSTFSSGQRQLLSFARTMALQPRILVLDEATASVDTETEEAIQRALNKMRQGRTTIAIAHRLSTIQDADLILVLHRGEIVERGTHQELLARQGLYHKMFLLQAGNLSNS